MADFECRLRFASGQDRKDFSLVAFSQLAFEEELLVVSSPLLRGSFKTLINLVSPLNVALYVKDKLSQDNQLIQECIQGCISLTMCAGCGRMPVIQNEWCKFKIQDIEGTVIADAEGRLSWNADSSVVAILPPVDFRGSVAAAEDSLFTCVAMTKDQQGKWERGSNITPLLPHFPFLAVRQYCGIIPMWAFLLLNVTPSPTGPPIAYLENALENALFLLNIEAPESRADFAEVLGEMQTLSSRAQQYTVDYTKTAAAEKKQLDKWENPMTNPTPGYAASDCEDTCVSMVQEGQWLLACDGKSQRLQPYIDVERQYVTFMAGMSLQLEPGNWCYHAVVLKLDRQYVMHKLQGKSPGSGKRWPAVLLEGTNYTTSCWEYQTKWANADRLSEKSAVELSGGRETISKATLNLMHKKNLYGAIQSLFSPELATKYGVVQIELGRDNKQAAPIRSVMEYDSEVEWRPIRLDPGMFMPMVQSLHSRFYPVNRPPTITTKPKTNALIRKRTPEVECLVRWVDYNDPDFAKEVANQFRGNKLQVRQLSISDDLKLAHLSTE